MNVKELIVFLSEIPEYEQTREVLMEATEDWMVVDGLKYIDRYHSLGTDYTESIILCGVPTPDDSDEDKAEMAFRGGRRG